MLFDWRSVDASLSHQIANTFLQIVDSVAHVVYAGRQLVRHQLELVLNALQHVLHLMAITKETINIEMISRRSFLAFVLT